MELLLDRSTENPSDSTNRIFINFSLVPGLFYVLISSCYLYVPYYSTPVTLPSKNFPSNEKRSCFDAIASMHEGLKKSFFYWFYVKNYNS